MSNDNQLLQFEFPLNFSIRCVEDIEKMCFMQTFTLNIVTIIHNMLTNAAIDHRFSRPAKISYIKILTSKLYYMLIQNWKTHLKFGKKYLLSISLRRFNPMRRPASVASWPP